MTATPSEPLATPLESSSGSEPLPTPSDNASSGSKSDESAISPLWLVGALVALGILASWSWVIVIVGIVAMLFLHELGHFLTARWTGMQPTEFFLGFGPKLWSFNKGETEFGLKAIPAGAYVRIVGMNNLSDTEPEHEDRAYRLKSYPRKLLVVSAGSIMHFLVALVLLYVLIVQYGIPSQDGWEVDRVVAQSAAFEIGIRPGDRIISVDDESVDSFGHFANLIEQRGGKPVEIAYERDAETIMQSVMLGARLSGAGADAFEGLLPRDRILSINGSLISGWDDVVTVIDGRIGSEFDFVVDPAGPDDRMVIENVTINSVPPAEEALVGFLGVGARNLRTPVGAIEGVHRSIIELGSFTKLSAVGMWDFFVGGGLGNFLSDTFLGSDAVDNSRTDTLQDPAPVRRDSGQAPVQAEPEEDRILSIYGAARAGAILTDDSYQGLIVFFVGLNIFVGLFNMIPLPPLDGGYVAVATYERIRSLRGRRHEVDYAKVMPLTYTVVFLLIAIGLVALFRDIIDPINLG